MFAPRGDKPIGLSVQNRSPPQIDQQACAADFEAPADKPTTPPRAFCCSTVSCSPLSASGRGVRAKWPPLFSAQAVPNTVRFPPHPAYRPPSPRRGEGPAVRQRPSAHVSTSHGPAHPAPPRAFYCSTFSCSPLSASGRLDNQLPGLGRGPKHPRPPPTARLRCPTSSADAVLSFEGQQPRCTAEMFSSPEDAPPV